MHDTTRLIVIGMLLTGLPAFARAADEAKPKVVTNSVGMKLVLVPAGEFVMGSPESELDIQGKHRPDEIQHRVKITKPFYMGVYPVTRAQFARFVAETGYKTDVEKSGLGSFGWDPPGRGGHFPTQRAAFTWRSPGMYGNTQTDDHPVVAITWNDSQAYLRWLSNKEKRAYRLPTDAEWEYACRAGTTTAYHFGDKLNGDNANCDGTVPYGTATKGPALRCTTPVGTYKPNTFGLYDMHGNVAQYCSDYFDYSHNYYKTSPVDDPQGPAKGDSHVTRSGGWGCAAVGCRSAARFFQGPNQDLFPRIGFRVVVGWKRAQKASAKE